ncbi:MAG: enterobactin synthetase component D [Alteromonadaceae bacterium]|jgi:enterobactin synthetase component D
MNSDRFSPKNNDMQLCIQSTPFVLTKRLIVLPGSELQAWVCHFDTQQFKDDEFSYILNNSSLSARAVTKRKAEHVAGRLCIHWCYQMLTNQTLPIIHADKHGCPVWPFPFKGSISHSQTMAVGVLTQNSNVLSLGVDIETILNDKTTAEIVNMVLSSTEQSVHTSLYNEEYNEEMPFNRFVTLVFSAKEAIYKALYPLVKHFFDFSAATLVSISKTKIQFVLQNNALPEIVDMAPIDVTYRIENNQVLTACIIEQSFRPYIKLTCNPPISNFEVIQR